MVLAFLSSDVSRNVKRRGLRRVVVSERQPVEHEIDGSFQGGPGLNPQSSHFSTLQRADVTLNVTFLL